MLIICPSWEDTVVLDWVLRGERALEWSFHCADLGVGGEGTGHISGATDFHYSYPVLVGFEIFLH